MPLAQNLDWSRRKCSARPVRARCRRRFHFALGLFGRRPGEKDVCALPDNLAFPVPRYVGAANSS